VVRYFVTSCPADDFDGCVSIPPRAGRPAALLYHKWAESAFHFIHFFISLSEESIAPAQVYGTLRLHGAGRQAFSNAYTVYLLVVRIPLKSLIQQSADDILKPSADPETGKGRLNALAAPIDSEHPTDERVAFLREGDPFDSLGRESQAKMDLSTDFGEPITPDKVPPLRWQDSRSGRGPGPGPGPAERLVTRTWSRKPSVLSYDRMCKREAAQQQRTKAVTLSTQPD
jgi:hypothetical protein